MSIQVSDILKYLDNTGYRYDFAGDTRVSITGFCSLKHPKSNSISWVKVSDENSLSGFTGLNNNIVVCQRVIPYPGNCVGFILTDKPRIVFFDILNAYFKKETISGISPSSTVLTKNIGKNVTIGSNCYIGHDVTIGDNTVIHHNVVIECPTTIGRDCIIHSGVVIGSDGFGYNKDENRVPVKINHYGGVTIGDRVEIGANTCIDRGTIDDTVIGNDSKIDNLCHIAHNVIIGNNVFVTALSMLGGSVTLEDNVYIAPGVTVMNQITIGKNSFAGLGAVVTKNVYDNKVVVGVPAKVLRDNT